ncbi:MAG: RlpA-like double-psi beta-barrel domain-containing protein [Acetobacteraceae bacterium]|nr:RlpA-like double-psi beta-barrel domain-containing protein [Acetobacteraceae bacterium]
MNMMVLRRAVCGVLLLAFGCTKPAPQPAVHYVLGKPYQASGVWHYPADSYELDETGLADVLPDGHAALTSDGEVFDQGAMAAAHATLQLPAIARLTDLETGRSVLLRLNDRGTGNPRRLVEVTRRVAMLLGISPGGGAQVRLQVLSNESRAAVDGLPDAPHLGVVAAPRGAVEATDLPPPPGSRQGGGHLAPGAHLATEQATPTTAVPLLRLPEAVTQGPAQPGRLWVRLDTFEEYQYAAVQRAKLSGLGPAIVSPRIGRTQAFRVQIGPIATVAQADAVLNQALAAGIPDARIVVE